MAASDILKRIMAWLSQNRCHLPTGKEYILSGNGYILISLDTYIVLVLTLTYILGLYTYMSNRHTLICVLTAATSDILIYFF